MGNIPLVVALVTYRILPLFDKPHYIALGTDLHYTMLMVGSMTLVMEDIDP